MNKPHSTNAYTPGTARRSESPSRYKRTRRTWVGLLFVVGALLSHLHGARAANCFDNLANFPVLQGSDAVGISSDHTYVMAMDASEVAIVTLTYSENPNVSPNTNRPYTVRWYNADGSLRWMGAWTMGTGGDKELAQAAVKLADDSLSVAIFIEEDATDDRSILEVRDANGGKKGGTLNLFPSSEGEVQIPRAGISYPSDGSDIYFTKANYACLTSCTEWTQDGGYFKVRNSITNNNNEKGRRFRWAVSALVRVDDYLITAGFSRRYLVYQCHEIPNTRKWKFYHRTPQSGQADNQVRPTHIAHSYDTLFSVLHRPSTSTISFMKDALSDVKVRPPLCNGCKEFYSFTKTDPLVLDLFVESKDVIHILYTDENQAFVGKFDFRSLAFLQARNYGPTGVGGAGPTVITSGRLLSGTTGYFAGQSSAFQKPMQSDPSQWFSLWPSAFQMNAIGDEDKYQGFIMSLTMADTCNPDYPLTTVTEAVTIDYWGGTESWDNNSYESDGTRKTSNANAQAIATTTEPTGAHQRAWCLAKTSLLLQSSLTDQLWYFGQTFTYTYPHWYHTPACDDLVTNPPHLRYQLAGVYSVIDGVDVAYVPTDPLDTTNVNVFASRTITSGAIEGPPTGGAMGDVYRVVIDGFLESHQFLRDSFTITVANFCLDNELVYDALTPDIAYILQADGSSPAMNIVQKDVTSTNTEAFCPLERTLEWYDDTANTWKLYSVYQPAYIANSVFTAETLIAQAFWNFDVQTSDVTLDDEQILSTVQRGRFVVKDPESTRPTGIIYDEFEVIINNECDVDALTHTIDLGTQVYNIDGTTKTITPLFTQLLTNCQQDYELEVYDSDASVWVSDLTGYPFLTKDDAPGNQMTVTVSIANAGLYKPQTDYQVRAVFTSRYSELLDVSDRVISEEFTLSLVDPCAANTLTQTTPLPDYLYAIGDPSVPFTPTFTTAISTATCLITAELFFFDTATNVWHKYGSGSAYDAIVQNFDGYTGEFQMLTNDFATFDPFTGGTWTVLPVRITLKDLNSAQANSQIIEEFDLTLRNPCSLDELTFVEQANFVYLIGDPTTAAIGPTFTQSVTVCPLSYVLEIQDDNTGLWNDYASATSTYPFIVSWVNGQFTVNDATNNYKITTQFSMRVVATSDQSEHSSRQITDEFLLTLTTACAGDQLSFLGDIPDFTVPVDNTIVTKTPDPTQSVTPCPLTYAFELYDVSVGAFVDYTVATQATGFVTNFDQTIGKLDMQTNDRATYDPDNSAGLVYEARIVITDPDSSQTEKQIIDFFEITFKDPCALNVLTQTGGQDIQDQTYYIDTGNSAAIAMAVTQSSISPLCTIDFALQFWDTSTSSWVDYSAVTHPFVQSFMAGSLVLETDEYSSYDNTAPTVIDTRIVATARASEMATTSRVLEDRFTLTLKDECRDLIVTQEVVEASAGEFGTLAAPVTWDLWQLQEINFMAATFTTPNSKACPVEYQITERNFERRVLPQYSLSGTKWSGFDTDPEDTFETFYYVRGLIKTINSNTVVHTSEQAYYIKVINPCLRTNSINAQAISAMENWIKDMADIVDLNAFTDQATALYSAKHGGVDLCGPKSYAIYKSDQLTEHSEAFLTLTLLGSVQWRLSLQSNDPADYTNADVQYYLRVSLDDYRILNPDEVIHFEPFTINLKNCQVDDLVTVPVADIPYNVYTPIVEIPITEFVQVASCQPNCLKPPALAECGYVLTYEARWFTFYGTHITLPSFIIWDKFNWLFTVQTDDPTMVGEYEVELKAMVQITDMDPIYEEYIRFKIIVSNGCLLDEVTVTSAIGDQTHYINYDPQLNLDPTWTQTVDGCPVTFDVYYTDSTSSARLALEASKTTVCTPFTFQLIPTNVPFDPSAWSPFTANLKCLTADFAYDLEEWNMNLVMASRESTHANREGSEDFKLTLLDLCWDMVLTAPSSADAVYDLWQSYQHPFTSLANSNEQACYGFTHELIYVAGPFDSMAHPTDPLLIGPDLTLHFTQGAGTFDATHTDFEWLGVHTFKIKGTNGNLATANNRKLYKSSYTADFTITILNPCETSIVQDEPLQNFEIGVKSGIPETWYYDNNKDSASVTYGDGYDKCGPRVHYITNDLGGGIQYPDQKAPRNWLSYFYLASGDPADLVQPSTPSGYQFTIQSSSNDDVGVHDLRLYVGLEDYPSATKSRTDFKVTIHPCLVTSYNAPGDLIETYVIGSTSETIRFHYAQAPCSYEATYSLSMVDGSLLPKFIKSNDREPYLNIFTTSEEDKGYYEIKVTSVLDNIYNGGATKDGVYDPDDLADPDNPDIDLITTDSFTLKLFVKLTEGDYVKPPNTAPFFVPEPYDLVFNTGNAFNHTFGPAYDIEGNNIEVRVQFDKDSREFATFDSFTNSIIVQANATDESNQKRHSVAIVLTDDADATQGGFQETIYQIILEVTDREIKPFEVEGQTEDELYGKYGEFVYDLRNQSKTNMTEGVGHTQNVLAPIPFLKSLDNLGVLKIGFDRALKLPANITAVRDKEVALRWLASRTETYLLDDGYKDFDIRPALELQVEPGDDSDPYFLEFTWELLDFTQREITVQLEFQYPPYLSSNAKADNLIVTFWGNQLFTSTEGVPVRQGTTLRKEIKRQIEPHQGEAVKVLSTVLSVILRLLIFISFFAFLLLGGDMVPFWAMVNTLQLLIHLPLMNVEIPGFAALFLKGLLDVTRFEFVPLDGLVNRLTGYRPDADIEGGLNAVFEQYGYESKYMIPNLGLIWIAFLILCAATVLAGVKDLLTLLKYDFKAPFLRRQTKWYSFMSNVWTRFMLEVFLEMTICILINFTAMGGSASFQRSSSACSVILFIVLGLFLLFVLSLLAYKWYTTDPGVPEGEPASSHKTLFLGLNTKHQARSLMYPVWFLTRRLIFSICVVAGGARPVGQVMTVLVCSLLMWCLLLWCRPYDTYDYQALQLFNEAMILLACIHMLCFTGFVADMSTNQSLGFTLILLVIVTFFVNSLVLIHSLWVAANRMCAKRGLISVANSNINQIVVERTAEQQAPGNKVADVNLVSGVQNGNLHQIVEEDCEESEISDRERQVHKGRQPVTSLDQSDRKPVLLVDDTGRSQGGDFSLSQSRYQDVTLDGLQNNSYLGMHPEETFDDIDDDSFEEDEGEIQEEEAKSTEKTTISYVDQANDRKEGEVVSTEIVVEINPSSLTQVKNYAEDRGKVNRKGDHREPTAFLIPPYARVEVKQEADQQVHSSTDSLKTEEFDQVLDELEGPSDKTPESPDQQLDNYATSEFVVPVQVKQPDLPLYQKMYTPSGQTQGLLKKQGTLHNIADKLSIKKQGTMRDIADKLQGSDSRSDIRQKYNSSLVRGGTQIAGGLSNRQSVQSKGNQSARSSSLPGVFPGYRQFANDTAGVPQTERGNPMIRSFAQNDLNLSLEQNKAHQPLGYSIAYQPDAQFPLSPNRSAQPGVSRRAQKGSKSVEAVKVSDLASFRRYQEAGNFEDHETDFFNNGSTLSKRGALPKSPPRGQTQTGYEGQSAVMGLIRQKTNAYDAEKGNKSYL